MPETEIKSSSRDFVDAADVRGQFLYRKDGYILTYLRIYPYNLELMGKAERAGVTNSLSATFKDDRKDWTYLSLPREIDMDKYKVNLKERYQQEMVIGKRQLLNMMMEQCAGLIMNGNNYEHQHFIGIWRLGSVTERTKVEEALSIRIKEFETRYRNVGIECEILQESEIVKLCNLFGNSIHASHELVDASTLYSPIMIM